MDWTTFYFSRNNISTPIKYYVHFKWNKNMQNNYQNILITNMLQVEGLWKWKIGQLSMEHYQFNIISTTNFQMWITYSTINNLLRHVSITCLILVSTSFLGLEKTSGLGNHQAVFVHQFSATIGWDLKKNEGWGI